MTELTTESKDLLVANITKITNELPAINKEQALILNNAKDSIAKAYNNTPHFRTSRAARDFSVLNDIKHATPESKYFQCMREMECHSLELIGLNFRYKEKTLDMEILESEIEELEDKLTNPDLKPYEVKKLTARLNKKRIKLDESILGLNNMSKEAKHRVREVQMWDEKMKELEPVILERGFSLDSPEDSELISYAARFIQTKRLHVLNNVEQSGAEAVNHDGQLLTLLRMIKEQKLENIFFDNIQPDDRYFALQYNLIELDKVSDKYKGEFWSRFILIGLNQVEKGEIDPTLFSNNVKQILAMMSSACTNNEFNELLKTLDNRVLSFLIDKGFLQVDGQIEEKTASTVETETTV
jgi:hypothetical protein